MRVQLWHGVQLLCFHTDLGNTLSVNLGSINVPVQGLPAEIQETENNENQCF